MRALLVLLGMSCAAQNVSYRMYHPQSGESGNTLLCCDPGEQLCLGQHSGCYADFSFGWFESHSYGARPTPIRGDWLYDVGETVALMMVAPAPALVGGAALGTRPWEMLFANPATLGCCFGKPVQMWKSFPSGQPELIDYFGYSCPLGYHLSGTSWVIQWARTTENGEIAFSNAMDVVIQ